MGVEKNMKKVIIAIVIISINIFINGCGYKADPIYSSDKSKTME